MSDLIGLPKPPAVGATALPAGTFDGATVFVTGAGTGLGKAIAAEFARAGAAIVIASRKPEHLDAGREAIEAIGARFPTVIEEIALPSIGTAAAGLEGANEARQPLVLAPRLRFRADF